MVVKETEDSSTSLRPGEPSATTTPPTVSGRMGTSEKMVTQGDVSYSQSDYLSQTTVMSLNPGPETGAKFTNGDSMGRLPAFSQQQHQQQQQQHLHQQQQQRSQPDPSHYYYGRDTTLEQQQQQNQQHQQQQQGEGMPTSSAPVPIHIEPLPTDSSQVGLGVQQKGQQPERHYSITPPMPTMGPGSEQLDFSRKGPGQAPTTTAGYGRYGGSELINNTEIKSEFDYRKEQVHQATPLKIPRYSAMYGGDTKNYSGGGPPGYGMGPEGHQHNGEGGDNVAPYDARPGSRDAHSVFKPREEMLRTPSMETPPGMTKTELEEDEEARVTSSQQQQHAMVAEKGDTSPLLRSGDDQPATHSDSGIVHDGGSNTSSNSTNSGEHDDLKHSHSPPLPPRTSSSISESNGGFRYNDGGPPPPMSALSSSTPSDLKDVVSSRGGAMSSPFMTPSSNNSEVNKDKMATGNGSDGGSGSHPPFPSPLSVPSGDDASCRSTPERRPLSVPHVPHPLTPGMALPTSGNNGGFNMAPSAFLSPSPGSSGPMPSPRNPLTPGSGSNHSPSPEPYPPGMFDANKDVYFCHLCSYVGTSQFHFKQHMDTHFEHRCPHCDYTSRTEGRLKRHIKDFHSDVPPDNYSGNRTPRNALPKPKVYKCKQCDYQSMVKVDFWEHSRSHIKEDKVLQCPKCPFVTEYKHHLEYHLRNHFGSKPFKCLKCNYACVNKSMLNSHMKSHTNVYQYRCADCTYATKYCHSLKLHLKKYNHKPATVLNADGSLPVDGSGDFELVSKRGPPRGPRGPRKGERMEQPGMNPGVNPMMMPQMGMNGMPPHGLMPGYWPMMPPMPNGALHPPPPLIPVSGSSFMPNLAMSLQGPPQPDHQMMMHRHHQQQQHMAEHGDKEHPDRPSNGGPGYAPRVKCVICDFTTDSRPSLNDHMLKVHAKENQDLLNMFGVQPDNFTDDHSIASQAAAAAAAAAMSRPLSGGSGPSKNEVSETAATPIKQEIDTSSGQSSPPPANQAWIMNTSQPGARRSTPGGDMFPSPMFRSTPQSSMQSPQLSAMDHMQQQMMKERYNAAIAAEIATNIEAEAKQNGECPLDLTKRKEQMQLAASQMFFNPSFMFSQMQKRKFDEMSMVAMAAASASQGPYPQAGSPPSLSGDNSGTPRKRSRKGKAYKLDTICQKLQERYGDGDSPPPAQGVGSGDEDTSDSINSGMQVDGGRPRSNGNNDTEKIDYNAIHSSLNELNNQSTDSYRGGANGRNHQREADEENDISGSGQENNSATSAAAAGLTFSSSINRRKLFMVRHNEEQAGLSGGDNSEVNGQEIYRGDHRTNDEGADRNNTGAPAMDLRPSTESPAESRPSSPPYECNHCGMGFRDCVMYTVHMGYHGYQDPFKCNMCGHVAQNRVEFFLHIARAAHE